MHFTAEHIKLEVEKKKRAAMEEEDVQIAKEQRDKEIDRLEGERAALEKQREEAVQSVQQIAAEKEEQQKLVDEKKIPKASLKQLLLKHMNHLKAVEKFNLKLKTLQAKEEKIHADHSAAVAKAKIEKQKHIGKLLRKHKKALDRIALIEAERRRINQLEKKIRDDKSAADKKSALLKKNRFSNLMKNCGTKRPFISTNYYRRYSVSFPMRSLLFPASGKRISYLPPSNNYC